MQTDELLKCIENMADAMNYSPLSRERAEQLIEHVLFEREYNGVEGKGSWDSFSSGLITEREVRNILMAHAATKIARENELSEPNMNDYNSPELCHSFEQGLFGKPVMPKECDVLDSWEKSNT